jgi:hypothetical protein
LIPVTAAIGHRTGLRLHRLRQTWRGGAAEVFPGQHGHRLVPWSARFVDPIILPDGRKLETLRDAAAYLTELPQAEHDAKEWQTAMEALLLVAEHDGPEMMARIGMMQALNRHSAKADSAPRRRNTHPFSDEFSETLEAGPPLHLPRVEEWTTMASIPRS